MSLGLRTDCRPQGVADHFDMAGVGWIRGATRGASCRAAECVMSERVSDE
jgi:hypothetical protein